MVADLLRLAKCLLNCSFWFLVDELFDCQRKQISSSFGQDSSRQGTWGRARLGRFDDHCAPVEADLEGGDLITLPVPVPSPTTVSAGQV